MTIDHDALRALALAATPGPWEARPVIDTWIKAGHLHIATIARAADGDWAPQNAAYIAAANPAAVLALLDEVKRLREALELMLEAHPRFNRPIGSPDSPARFHQARQHAAIESARAALSDGAA